MPIKNRIKKSKRWTDGQNVFFLIKLNNSKCNKMLVKQDRLINYKACEEVLV
jgi:hypothetical protein